MFSFPSLCYWMFSCKLLVIDTDTSSLIRDMLLSCYYARLF